MDSLENLLGDLCKRVLPIKEEYFLGSKLSSIAICTLSSMNLLRTISKSDLMKNISIVGRLLSENKGIDSLVRYVNLNKQIKTIIVCGREVTGHKAAHSLFELHRNGIDTNGKIINSKSPKPFLTVNYSEVNYFQNKIKLVDLINEESIGVIRKKII